MYGDSGEVGEPAKARGKALYGRGVSYLVLQHHAPRRNPYTHTLTHPQAMKDAGVQPKDIQEVLLVGGMTRMPKVRGGREAGRGKRREGRTWWRGGSGELGKGRGG